MADPSNTETIPSDGLESLGTVVVLLTSGEDRQWAADAAIDLCSEWAAAGRRVVLADLHLEDPQLHQGLEVPNLEGIVDIFVYGASMARIAKPVRNGAFFFIPAGTYAPDAAEIYDNPRWRKLVAGFQDTDATLVLFAPGEGADVEALSAWSRDMVLLGPPPTQERLDELASFAFQVRATVQPSVAEPAAGIPVPDRDTGSGAADEESFPARVAPTIVHRPPESELELPPPPKRQSAHSGVSIALWVLLAVVVVAALGYLLFSLRPDLLPGASPERPPGAEAMGGAQPPDGPASRAELLPYSVPLKAFRSLSAARAEVSSNQQRLPSVPFYISAESDQGILYYRVFAGVSPDTIVAGLLRERLIAEGMIDEDESLGRWSLVEFTPLAFDLGEFDTMEAAASQIDSLLARSIPVYATAIPYADGTRRWQLYGGAFRDSSTSTAMGDMLAANGISGRLSTRSGERAADTGESSQ